LTAEAILDALDLPKRAKLGSRLPKQTLADKIALTAADRKAVREEVETANWLAALKPENIGVPAVVEDEREYREIHVVGVVLRSDKRRGRLLTLLHRGIPYPLLLLAETPGEIFISVADKRITSSGKAVLDTLYPLDVTAPERFPADFVGEISLSGQPLANMRTLYNGWVGRVAALGIWETAGVYLPAQATFSHSELVNLLNTLRRLERDIHKLGHEAARARRMSRRVELNMEHAKLKGERRRLIESLKEVGVWA